MQNSTTYLDYNATTPVAKEVLDEMLPYFSSFFGNAASRTHVYRWEADDAIKTARSRVADLLEVDPNEIIFTSGATESDNLALKGIYEALSSRGNRGNHIITSGAEHKAILDACKHIESIRGEVMPSASHASPPTQQSSVHAGSGSPPEPHVGVLRQECRRRQQETGQGNQSRR